MIAAVIAETCGTPTCSLVEVFMINEYNEPFLLDNCIQGPPIQEIPFFPENAYIIFVSMTSFQETLLFRRKRYFFWVPNPGLISIQFSIPWLSNHEGGSADFKAA